MGFFKNDDELNTLDFPEEPKDPLAFVEARKTSSPKPDAYEAKPKAKHYMVYYSRPDGSAGIHVTANEKRMREIMNDCVAHGNFLKMEEV